MSRTRRQKAALQQRRVSRLRIVTILGFLGLLAFSSLVLGSCSGMMSSLPKLEDQSMRDAQTSKMYAANGKMIARFFVEQNRDVIPLAQIPESMQLAVIAIEDERFYEHKGVDLQAVGRALWMDLRHGRVIEGGSTITQQYVKNTFITPEKTLKRKIKEAALAYQLEKKYNKREILEKYLNTIYFGQSAYGVQVAAQTFFGRHARQLSLDQSALLAGLIRSPNTYSPYTNPEVAKNRRALVLNKMVQLKFITKGEAERAKAKPLKLKTPRPAAAFAPYFVEYVKQEILDDPRFGPTPSSRANALYKGGLRIRTTLDMRMQRAAEQAAFSTLGQPDDPSVGLVAVDPKTGHIKALVGGRDFKKHKFNLAVQGRRQPGSSFKIFVLAAALAKGISPNDTYESGGITIQLPGEDWHVGNTEGGGGPAMDLWKATAGSVNGVFARLVMDVGAKNVVKYARKMGITSHLDPWPSIALGGLRFGVSPLEMASAAGTLANHGVRVKPSGITKITDSSGEPIYKTVPDKKRALSADVADLETNILEGVIQGGTGRAAAIGRPAAGKTGTAQNYQDAWFVGYTPQLAAAVWVGFPNELIPMNNVRGITVMGGTFPAEIWAKFMSVAHEGLPELGFERVAAGESKGEKIKICVESELLATDYCPDVIEKHMDPEDAPKKYCNIHTKPLETKSKVPNVVGMGGSTAESTLKSAGFDVNRVSRPKSGVASGIVYAQSPGGGTNARQGSSVTIYVSSGEGTGGKPRASFSLSKSGTTVSVSASGSTGNIVSYSWSFGDGGSAGGKSASHSYAPGTYTVTLTVTDSGGRTDSTSNTVTVP